MICLMAIYSNEETKQWFFEACENITICVSSLPLSPIWSHPMFLVSSPIRCLSWGEVAAT
jgi:hypothetical protein